MNTGVLEFVGEDVNDQFENIIVERTKGNRR